MASSVRRNVVDGGGGEMERRSDRVHVVKRQSPKSCNREVQVSENGLGTKAQFRILPGLAECASSQNERLRFYARLRNNAHCRSVYGQLAGAAGDIPGSPK